MKQIPDDAVLRSELIKMVERDRKQILAKLQSTSDRVLKEAEAMDDVSESALSTLRDQFAAGLGDAAGFYDGVIDYVRRSR